MIQIATGVDLGTGAPRDLSAPDQPTEEAEQIDPDDAPIVPVIEHMVEGGLHAPIKLATIFVRYMDLSSPEMSDEIGTPWDAADAPGVWRILSQMTHGDARAVDGDGFPPGGVSLADFVKTLILDVNSTCTEITVNVSDPGYTDWVSVGGSGVPAVVATDVTPPASLPFVVSFQPPAATPVGLYSFQVQAFCDGVFLAAQDVQIEVTSCTSNPPGMGANSLLAFKTGAPSARFEWTSSGTGQWNLHTTRVAVELAELWRDMAAVLSTESLPFSADDGSYPLGFYQVYGVDNCTGLSVP